MQKGFVRACHDLSEGGLAAAIAEMAFAGGLGAHVDLANVPHQVDNQLALDAILLFSESNTRFVCEVPLDSAADFERHLASVPHARIGRVEAGPKFEIVAGQLPLVMADVAKLKAGWQAPLDWH